MTLLLISLSGVLGLLFLWGLISPRTQWYALVGWTRSNPRATEPGSVAYATSRFVSFVGLVAVLGIAGSWAAGVIHFGQGTAAVPPNLSEKVWGEPESHVVDRVFTPLAAPPEGLVAQAISGYQAVDAPAHSPEYLYGLGKIRQAGLAMQPGFIGVLPLPGTVALDTSDLVVHVRGDDRCFPQQVVVVPADESVQVGIFFGQANPADGSNAAEVGNCDPGPPAARTKAYLIPIDLATPLGARIVQSLDGTPIPKVPLPVR